MRKNQIRRAALRAARVIDRPPVCYIAFTAFVIVSMIACGLAFNSVVPAYQ